MRFRRKPTKAELVEKKHRLEGEINVLSAEVRRRRSRGESTAETERRLERARTLHYQTRLEIDRAS